MIKHIRLEHWPINGRGCNNGHSDRTITWNNTGESKHPWVLNVTNVNGFDQNEFDALETLVLEEIRFHNRHIEDYYHR